MLFLAFIYIVSIWASLTTHTVLVTFILTSLFVFFLCKNIVSGRYALIFMLVFYFGLINTNIRLKETDDLLSLAPRNANITGKIISVPQRKDNDKQSFFFDVNSIKYDNIVKDFKKEKLLVTLNSTERFNIYDSYEIRGRLSGPFKAGNPSQFDYGNYLRNFNTYAVFYGRNPYNWEGNENCFQRLDIVPSGLEKVLQNINNYRERILNIHSHYLQSPNLEILGGIVFGDDAVSPPKDIKQSFINSGLLHILAASGMNVAFIFSFFFFILNLFRINYKLNVSICMVAIITYVLMTGLGASVLRAGLMLLFVLLGKLIDRDAHSISLLSFVAILMLIYNPMYINDVGFQLSFIVTFGLLVMTPYLIKSKFRIINWVIGSVCIPIIAQIWVIPIQVFYFNNISLYSVFANIMSVPFLSVISFGGFVSSLLAGIAPISSFVCQVFDTLLNPFISLLVNVSDFWGSMPNSTIQTIHPSVIQIILYYLFLLNIVGFVNKEIREKYFNILKITLISIFFIFIISFVHLPNPNLEITAFDVGNADAFLIKTPNNKFYIIDTGKEGYNGGKSQAEIIILKYFKDNGIKNIDSLIITHFDNDHSGGAVDLIKNLKIEKVYVNSISDVSNSAKRIYSAAKERGVELIEVKNNLTILNKDGLVITNFISPKQSGIFDNESSILTLIKYYDFSMLFTGDAGVKTLNNLMNYIPQNLTVLKVGHHGAPAVINRSQASYLNPKFALISTGENKFGHPSMYTLEVLRNSNILRTDVNNSVRFIVNKNGYLIKTFNPPKRRFENEYEEKFKD